MIQTAIKQVNHVDHVMGLIIDGINRAVEVEGVDQAIAAAMTIFGFSKDVAAKLFQCDRKITSKYETKIQALNDAERRVYTVACYDERAALGRLAELVEKPEFDREIARIVAAAQINTMARVGIGSNFFDLESELEVLHQIYNA